MKIVGKIIPCLWFDGQAEEAATFYTSIFEGSRITARTCFPDAGGEVHGRPSGSVMTVTFEIAGHPFTALNAGPAFKFNEAISFQVSCETQEEIDYFCAKLSQGGTEGRCGWLKDKYGVSWQVVPSNLPDLLKHADPAKAGRAMRAMLQMTKFDIARLKDPDST